MPAAKPAVEKAADEKAADEKRPTFNEALEALTGFDELAIEKYFQFDLYERLVGVGDDDGNVKTLPVLLQRALIFAETRKEKGDPQAFGAVMNMRSSEVLAYFSDEDDSADQAEDGLPETEAGKDAG